MIYNKYVKYRNKTIEIKDLKPTSTVKIEMICQDCGKEFKRFANRLFQSGSFLCQSCSIKDKKRTYLDIGYKNNKLTVIAPSKESGKSIVLCDCGNKTEVFNRNLVSGKAKSCGCLRVENIKKVAVYKKGKDHHNWKGGISEENNLARTSKEYKKWRICVFERDNYTCQKCGKIGGDLNAHHIEEFSNNKEKRFCLNNGITFCSYCHIKFHKKYGRISLNKNIIEKFIRKQNGI